MTEWESLNDIFQKAKAELFGLELELGRAVSVELRREVYRLRVELAHIQQRAVDELKGDA